MDLGANEAGTDAGIVAAIKQAVGAVPLRIIERAPRLAVFARDRRLAGEQTGRPGAVVRLQTQFVVRLARGQLLQSVGQPAAVDDPTGTVGRLPKAVDCHEQLMRIAPLLSKLAGAGIGLGRLDRAVPSGRE